VKTRQKISWVLALIIVVGLLQGCGLQGTQESTEEPEEEVVADLVEKEKPIEGPLVDNEKVYEEDDDTSVIKMYLTVSSGNEGDGSNHSWTEVNTYSADYYSSLGVDRYKVEGILQIDEGEGITEESFGYGETVPNVSVQVRGQTSSRSHVKNYKVRIKDGKGEFRSQRTLNLNKHLGDTFRFVNKLCYDLLDDIPQLLGGRTQFAQLFVRDTTEGGNGEYVDYGLYTIVEQINKTYLKNRGLDENGQLYKVTFFEWDKYDAISVSSNSPDFDQVEFEKYLEIKGDEDNSKLNAIVEKVNNRMIPIETIIDEHFDAENICYWMAFNILIGNYDSGARNLFLYSPLNSEKFYMICWDLDASLRKSYLEYSGHSEGGSWERGMSQYLGLTLINRMLKEEKYREMLIEAVEDLHDNYVNCKIVDEEVQKYKGITSEFLYGGADSEEAKVDKEVFDTLVGEVGEEVEKNYSYFVDNLNNPWPFFVGLPEIDGDKMIINWDASYDINGEAVVYDYILAKDYDFTDIIVEGSNQISPSIELEKLDAGVYFMRVVATNESGYSQDCFDYYTKKSGGKVYACLAFEVFADGSSEVYTKR